MKILFISDVPLSYPASGSEQVLNNEVIGLSRRGFNVFAITRSNDKSRSVKHREINGVKEGCYYANTKNIIAFGTSLLKNSRELYDRFLNDEAFAISFCHQPFTFISLLLSGKLTSIPIVYVFHSPMHYEYLLSQEDKISFLKLPLAFVRKMIEGFCLKRAHKIIVLSNFMKSEAMRVHRIKDSHITVIPGGVNLTRFKVLEDRKKAKGELNYSIGKVHLLTVRNLEPRMGIDNLLKGFYLLKKKGIPAQLIIAGEGPEKKKLRKIVKEYGLMADVTLTGFVPAEKLPQYYGAADFFILPTRDLEGFGLVTPESLACGTPVLGTPVGGTKEILEKFDTRFLFKDSTPNSMANGIQKAIEVFFSDEEKYNRLRTRCRQYASENYSWQRHIDTLESIIYKLVESEKIKN